MSNNFSNNNKAQRGIALAKLITELEKDLDGIGMTIISEHKIFKGQSISLFNQSTQRHDIHYVLDKLDGDDLDKSILLECYEHFDKIYKNLVKENINQIEKKNEEERNNTINSLVRKIKMLLNKVKIIKTRYGIAEPHMYTFISITIILIGHNKQPIFPKNGMV